MLVLCNLCSCAPVQRAGKRARAIPQDPNSCSKWVMPCPGVSNESKTLTFLGLTTYVDFRLLHDYKRIQKIEKESNPLKSVHLGDSKKQDRWQRLCDFHLSVHRTVGPLASKQIHESSLSCGCCGSMSQCHVQWLGSVGWSNCCWTRFLSLRCHEILAC